MLADLFIRGGCIMLGHNWERLYDKRGRLAVYRCVDCGKTK